MQVATSYGVVECASGYVVMCKRLFGDVQLAMWWPMRVPFGFRSYWDLVGVRTKGLGTGLDNRCAQK